MLLPVGAPHTLMAHPGCTGTGKVAANACHGGKIRERNRASRGWFKGGRGLLSVAAMYTGILSPFPDPHTLALFSWHRRPIDSQAAYREGNEDIFIYSLRASGLPTTIGCGVHSIGTAASCKVVVG